MTREMSVSDRRLSRAAWLLAVTQLVHGFIRARHMSKRAADSVTWMGGAIVAMAGLAPV